MKNKLEGLGFYELKFLAKKLNIKIKGRAEKIPFHTIHKPPSKKQHINGLSKVASEEEIDATLREIPPPQQ